MALISVIIPAYNAERTLERTVRSVMESTIPVDVWIVDDGSTDGTAALVDRLAASCNQTFQQSNNPAILHAIHQKNCGAYQARLNALKRIKTPYFGFVDADDTVESDMFEKMLNLAMKENLDVVQVGWKVASCGQSNSQKILIGVMDGRSRCTVRVRLRRRFLMLNRLRSQSSCRRFIGGPGRLFSRAKRSIGGLSSMRLH